jgi:hypothetical protein
MFLARERCAGTANYCVLRGDKMPFDDKIEKIRCLLSDIYQREKNFVIRDRDCISLELISKFNEFVDEISDPYFSTKREVVFVTLVRSMRSYQKEYFKTRSPDVLETCKQLEKEVDKCIGKERLE